MLLYTFGRGAAWLIGLLLLTLSPPVYSQTQQGNAGEPIKLSTSLVVLDAQVLNRKTGAVVADLKREDFVIYEDDVKQEITHFSQDKLPLSIILLLDLSGSVQPYVKQIRDGALQALQKLKPEDEVALVAFAARVQLVQGYTTDRQLIVDRIEKINETAHVGKATFLDEAVYQAAVQLGKASNPGSRRVIIVITDNVSNQFRFKGHSEKDGLHELFEYGGVVCGLIIGDALAKTLRTVNRVTKYHPLAYLLLRSSTVETYSSQTGGEVLGARTAEIEVKFTELVDRLRTRYAIGYVSSNTKLDGKFRKIKLSLSPDLKQEGEVVALTRRGYYLGRQEAVKR